MAALTCRNTRCGQTLGSDDVFCRNCGTPVPRFQRTIPLPDATRQYGQAPNGHPDATPPSVRASAPFFSHEHARPPGRLNNITRYLCAAAYLDNNFANRVIGELVATRRAVAPSLNVDIGPVIWHCRRARRNTLIRNIVLFGIVLLGLKLNPLVTIGFFGCAALFALLTPIARWAARVLKFVLVSLAPIVTLTFIFAFFSHSYPPEVCHFFHWGTCHNSSASAPRPAGSKSSNPKLRKPKKVRPSSSSPSSPSVGSQVGSLPGSQVGSLLDFTSDSSSGSSGPRPILSPVQLILLLLFLTWGTEFIYRSRIFRTLTKTLRPGVQSPTRRKSQERIALVEGAQWGNIALYATDDPFIGAGYKAEPQRGWSIAIRLDPADPTRRGYTRSPQDVWVPINPVELHEAIGEKLNSLNDPRLPANQRIASIRVVHRLVGSGTLRWDNPLVDASRLMPYSTASPEAVEAVIHHPQAHLRYYQHVMVNDEGPPVESNNQRVLNATDLGISISAFVYAAVEGRHLYLQFILTALPPIKPEYRIIDFLPTRSSGKALRSSIAQFLPATGSSINGIFDAIFLWMGERRTKRKARRTGDIPAGDLGARVSVRELGMADRLSNYIRIADIQKYNRIIERAVLETVRDFLSSKGVDISAFMDGALNIINGNVIGWVSGGTNQFGGSDSTFHQNQTGREHQQPKA